MKSISSFVFSALFLFFSPVLANAKTFQCLSHARDLSLTFEITDGDKAVLNVSKSSQKGGFALAAQTIQLKHRVPLLSGWVGYKGYSSLGQDVFFKTIENNLSQNQSFRAVLVVGAIDFVAIEIGNSLECSI